LSGLNVAGLLSSATTEPASAAAQGDERLMESEVLKAQAKYWMHQPDPGPLPPGRPLKEAHERGLIDYWHILLKRKWLILMALSITLACDFVWTLRTVREYAATSRIAVYRESTANEELPTAQSNTQEDDYTVNLATQVKLLESDSLILQVIRKLELGNNANFMPLPSAGSRANVSDARATQIREAAMVGIFKSHLKVAIIPGTRLIDVRFVNRSPELAATVADAVSAALVELNLRSRFEATMQASEWLSRQLADLQVKVEDSERKIVDYQKTHDLTGVDEKDNIVTSKLDEVSRDLTTAEMDRIQKEAQLRMILAEQGSGQAITSSLLEKLRGTKADLETQLADLGTQFGPNYPKIAEIRSELQKIGDQIQLEVDRVVHTAQSDYQAAVQKEKMLQDALNAQKEEANRLNETQIEYALLKRDAESNRQLYDGLQRKMKESTLEAGLQSSNIRVAETARIPVAPFSPNVSQNMAVGALIGIFLGIVVAIVLEGVDTTIGTSEELSEITGLSVIGLIPAAVVVKPRSRMDRVFERKLPELQQRQSPETLALTKPKSEVAEAFRAMRTAVLLSGPRGADPKVMMITSAMPADGKTTVACNLAIVLAQRGSRVLLVDADMRRPSIHRVLGVSNSGGLTAILTGTATLRSEVLPLQSVPGLDVLPAGPVPAYPAEILANAKFGELLEQCRREYDHVIIDTPPVLSVTDGVVVSVHADFVIIVARSRRTRRAAVRRAAALLYQAHANVQGVILNDIDLSSPDYAYQYGYRGYRYRYAYGDDSGREEKLTSGRKP
jgi:capsular exopolysaccharide synthesis family protein